MKKWLALLLLVSGCAFSNFMEAGDNAAKAGRWEAAYHNYARAAAEDEDSDEAKQKRDYARLQWLTIQATEARADAQRGDTLGAIVAARKAWEIWPEHVDAISVVKDISAVVSQHASRLAGQQDYANAVMLHEAAIRELDYARPVHVDQVASIKRTWQGVLAGDAQAAETAGRPADALLIWGKAAQLSNDAEHQRRYKNLRTQIQSEMAYLHAVDPKGADADYVASRLAETRRGTLTVAVGAAKAQSSSKLGVEAFRVSDKREAIPASVEYQSGVKQVANPFYESKLRTVQDEERRLSEAENDVTKLENRVSQYEQDVAREGDSPNTTTGAEQNLYYARNDLQRARDKVISQRQTVVRAKEDLAREQQFKEEPVYKTWNFQKIKVTRTATARLTLRVKHPDGRPDSVVNEDVTVAVSDEMHEAQSVAQLAADPLVLPTEADLRVSVRDAATERARTEILRDFAEWRGNVLKEAMARSNVDERVELLVRYVVADPKSADPAAVSELASHRKISDVLGVLSTP